MVVVLHAIATEQCFTCRVTCQCRGENDQPASNLVETWIQNCTATFYCVWGALHQVPDAYIWCLNVCHFHLTINSYCNQMWLQVSSPSSDHTTVDIPPTPLTCALTLPVAPESSKVYTKHLRLRQQWIFPGYCLMLCTCLPMAICIQFWVAST